GPILVSRDGLATSEPFHGDAVVLFGDPSLHDASLDYREGGRTLVFQSEALPSVAGGPADPEAWDEAFGGLNAFSEGDAEARARAAKAEALDPGLAALYAEVRAMREAGHADPARLEAILATLKQHPQDWLLKEEVLELMRPVPA
ncbi:MAG TPA: hypothetical protein VJ483_09535, partial [Holophagaceae bacterium]|nr:hypothetical protein [Holophagaceae bacterium]